MGGERGRERGREEEGSCGEDRQVLEQQKKNLPEISSYFVDLLSDGSVYYIDGSAL